MVRPPGLEPGTPGLEGRCSIRLSYGRICGAEIRRYCTLNLASNQQSYRLRPVFLVPLLLFDSLRAVRGNTKACAVLTSLFINANDFR